MATTSSTSSTCDSTSASSASSASSAPSASSTPSHSSHPTHSSTEAPATALLAVALPLATEPATEGSSTIASGEM